MTVTSPKSCNSKGKTTILNCILFLFYCVCIKIWIGKIRTTFFTIELKLSHWDFIKVLGWPNMIALKYFELNFAFWESTLKKKKWHLPIFAKFLDNPNFRKWCNYIYIYIYVNLAKRALRALRLYGCLEDENCHKTILLVFLFPYDNIESDINKFRLFWNCINVGLIWSWNSCAEGLQMAPNGSKWLQMASYGSKWLWIPPNGSTGL